MSLNNTLVTVNSPTETDADEVAMCCVIETNVIVEYNTSLALFFFYKCK